jgi:transposase
MKIVGCDFHPSWQQVAVFDPETGEVEERKLLHGDGEAERFYRDLEAPALIGIEACGNSQWFIELAEGLGHVVWIGDAAQIRASYMRRQKTDRRDAGHILKLLELEKLPLAGWTARRREDLFCLLRELNRTLDELDQAVGQAAQDHPQARLLMTQPGVGPITSLAYVLTIGDVSRFKHSKQVSSYLGLIPREHSSGGKQRLGSISKQGNSFMRQLLVEAAQTANRLDEGFCRQYTARCHHKPKGVAKVATARKLAVRLYWMLRQNVGYPEIARIESSPRVPLVGQGHTERLNGRSRIQQ